MKEKIFNRDWEEIRKMQQGEDPSFIPLTAEDYQEEADVTTEQDRKMLKERGLKWLIEHKFYGVLDRLERSKYVEKSW